jgi:hypothetical protein
MAKDSQDFGHLPISSRSLFFVASHVTLSLLRKAVGIQNILKETYLDFSWATFDFINFQLWSSHYVGLTKRGYLYIFSTLYDDISQALLTIDLRTIDVRITGDVSTLVIGISNPTVKFYLKFPTVDEFSSWLRQVSDFGVNAASQTVQSRAAERLTSTSTSERRPSHPVATTAPPGGGGVGGGVARNDEFSDMFGM